MKPWLWAFAALLGVAQPLHADGGSSEGLKWLQKIATSARELNYSGTFVYQYGSHVETSRIIHLVNASGEHEKLETLDGPPREIIRNNDEIQCYLPESKTVKVERRKPRKAFPALLPEQFSGLAENYRVKLVGRERASGFECQVLLLEPKDSLRYGHKLWAEAGSGLLLKATMLDEKGQVVEQFAFTQLEIGRPIDPGLLKPRLAVNAANWKRAVTTEGSAGGVDTGWVVQSPPAGFKKILETRRSLGGKPNPVTHIVLSDGLAAVSVFIEPLGANHPPVERLSSQGAINVYSRQVSDHLVTVLGETPPATVMQIANSIVHQTK